MLGKSELLEAIAGKNRGVLASATDKQAILAAIARLEDRNPTPRPLEAVELLGGNWRLLYTTNRELLNLDQFPLVKLGPVYQYIQASEQRVFNVAETYGVPYFEGLVSVAASFTASSEKRIEVKFNRAVVGLQRLLGYQSVMDWVQKLSTDQKFAALDFNIANRDQQGWLDITYLDADLRIGRGNQGNVFVLAKAPA